MTNTNPGTATATPPLDPQWIEIYLRMILSFLNVDATDVDFDRTFVKTYWREAFEWDEESGEPDSFCIQLTWHSMTPGSPAHLPIWDGSYQHLRNIEDRTAALFLNTLASILKETPMSDTAQPLPTDGVQEWVERYHRALLTHLGVEDLDRIDISEVSTSSGWEEAWSHSEYTGGGAQFSLTVTWRTAAPERSWHSPDPDGLFTHSRELTNEDVAGFLNSLTQH